MLKRVYGVRGWLLGQQWFTSTVLPLIPRRLRWTLRRLFFLPFDLIERAGRTSSMIPPKSQIFTGTVDEFQTSGDALVRRLVEHAGLEPGSQVLDIGSGIGRVAVALTDYLDGCGRYEGIDIVPSGVQWCQERITPLHPTFRFTLADLYNKEYNPTGKVPAASYRFPYPSGTFDVVLLTSVFTHLLPADFEHYVSEIARMLKPGGRCYATYSLIDDQTLRSIEAGRSSLRFRRKEGPCWVVDPRTPELAIGYEKDYVRDVYARNGLLPSLMLHGCWVDRQEPSERRPDFGQDIVVGQKPEGGWGDGSAVEPRDAIRSARSG